MHIHSRGLTIIVVLILASICAGCGGGGGGSSSTGGGGSASPPLGLSAASPTLTGNVGREMMIPVTVTGSGSVTTASLEIHVSEETFEPAATPSDTVREITDLPASATACYMWLDTRTIRVMYVSADGMASGSVLVNVPVKVKSETAAAPTLANIAINQ